MVHNTKNYWVLRILRIIYNPDDGKSPKPINSEGLFSYVIGTHI
jgi:hypothetical protein